MWLLPLPLLRIMFFNYCIVKGLDSVTWYQYFVLIGWFVSPYENAMYNKLTLRADD